MPRQILGPYVNHPSVTRDGAGNLFVAATQIGPGSNDDAVVILKRDVTTGQWSELTRLHEAIFGKPGLASLAVVVDDLHLLLSLRNAAGEQVLMEHIIPNVCVSWRDAIASQVQQAMAQYGGGGNTAAQLAEAIGDAVAPFRVP